MRIILFGIWLCIALGLPAEVQAKIPKDKLVTAAKPFVETALDTPMEVLIAKAVKDPTAKDQAFLGLAMLAGRHQPDDDQEVRNTQLLADMEARLLPKSDEYLEAHPGVDIRTVNWVDVLQPTSAELLAITNNQQHYSADYWLGLALTYRNMPFYSVGKFNAMGTGRSTGGGGGHPTQGYSGLYNADFALKKDIVMTAAACVRAVRTAAEVTYNGPLEALPTIVVLMRKFPYFNIDNTLANDEARSVEEKSYIGGSEACGTAAQFQTYVEMLKATG